MSDVYKLRLNSNTLCSRQTRQFVHKYKSFKWVLSGRWNQGSGNSGSTATYMEWDELGIGFDSGSVCYGSDYWTFDSYTLDGTPWSPNTRMPPVLLGGTWGTEASKFDASNFVSLVVYFHTTSGKAILPTSIGLYSSSNQNEYQSSTPLHFVLSGLNEETNEYEQLIDIDAANVNKGNTQLTTISSGFTYHYSTMTDIYPLSYIEEIQSEEWVNLGSTEYSKTSGSGITHYSFTGMPASSDFNYITFIFDAYLHSGKGAADIFLENSSNGTIWRMRAHYNKSYPGFVGIAANVTAWSTASGAPSVGSFTQDGVSYRYCSSKFTKGNYARFKLVFDRNAKTCYMYIGDTLLGTATLNTDPINITKFGLMREVSLSGETAIMKNIKVAGFKYLSDAQNWN